MEDTLIGFETAKLAKEKGYDNKLLTYYKNDLEKGDYLFEELIKNQTEWISNFQSKYEYDKNISVAPSQSLLQKWLREVHNIIVFVAPLIPYCKEFGVTIYSNKYICEKDLAFYNQYEKALEIGLQEALKLIK